jgi:DNA-binding NarL/FixJ family response regulator
MDPVYGWSVLLFPSERLGWATVRAILKEHRQTRIISEVHQAAACIAVAADRQPDLVITTSEPAGAPLGTRVGALRGRCPAVKIIVVGDLLAAEDHALLGRSGVEGYLIWASLTDVNLSHALELILEADVAIASRPVVARLFSHEPEPRPSSPPAVELSRIEDRVLHSLARGLTHGQIAREEHRSKAAVERISTSLRQKFDAPNLFVLAVRATEAGLLP